MALQKTPMGLVRGKGSAKDGTSAFWMQRLTAVALIPLSLLFVTFMVVLTGETYFAARTVMGVWWIAITMLMFILTGFYHLKIGMTHIVEDYIHWELGKFGLVILVNMGCIALGLACILSVVKLSLGSAS